MTYHVTIEEHVSDTFSITASSAEEALKKAAQCYKDGLLVVQPSTPTYVCACASNSKETTDWIELH